MKTKLRTISHEGVTYDALMFVCPGCVAGGPEGYNGIHMLPVNAQDLEIDKPWWTWNGDLEKPTLSPSILTNEDATVMDPYARCHSFLTDGVFHFLKDSTHPLAGKYVVIPDLPDWVEELSEEGDIDE